MLGRIASLEAQARQGRSESSGSRRPKRAVSPEAGPAMAVSEASSHPQTPTEVADPNDGPPSGPPSARLRTGEPERDAAAAAPPSPDAHLPR